MTEDSVESYFDSYERKSPARLSFIERFRIDPQDKGFSTSYLMSDNNRNAKGERRFVNVSQASHPKLYEVLEEEATFRKIELPACYIDTESQFPLAYARPEIEAIFITPETYATMNKSELRAVVAHEVKHLYSGLAQSDEETRLIELDCDRASIESTSYNTVRSYVDKAMTILLDKKVGRTVFSNFLHQFNAVFPGLIAESFVFRLDEVHPSPARRMQKMRQHEKKLDNRSNSWVKQLENKGNRRDSQELMK